MSTSDLKIHLHQLIESISDNSVLEAVQVLLSKASTDKNWWNSLSVESKVKTLNSLQELKNRKTVSHDIAMQQMSEKFPQLRF